MLNCTTKSLANFVRPFCKLVTRGAPKFIAWRKITLYCAQSSLYNCPINRKFTKSPKNRKIVESESVCERVGVLWAGVEMQHCVTKAHFVAPCKQIDYFVTNGLYNWRFFRNKMEAVAIISSSRACEL